MSLCVAIEIDPNTGEARLRTPPGMTPGDLLLLLERVKLAVVQQASGAGPRPGIAVPTPAQKARILSDATTG